MDIRRFDLEKDIGEQIYVYPTFANDIKFLI